MTRCVVNVATTPQYQRGQDRLMAALRNTGSISFGPLPVAWPTHRDKPYAFKAYALKEASKHAELLLWCDSCILPIRSLEPLWERIERDGYWFSRNGWSNYEWTAEEAYPDLFTDPKWGGREAIGPPPQRWLEDAKNINRGIEHVVATAFGLSMRHPKGRAFLDEYYRLASETRAFCGPWWNLNHKDCPTSKTTVCGPSDVRGHRHDQTAASVIAWRLGFELTSAPNIFAYKGGETEQTILVADGSVFA